MTPPTNTVVEGRCAECGWLIFRIHTRRILARHREPKQCPRCKATGRPKIAKTAYTDRFAERINPSRFNFSPKLVAIVGAIIGHDYGVRDGVRGGRLTGISITSDGFVMAGSTASDGGGAFIGAASDLDRNLAAYREALLPEDREAFDNLYKANVNDYRKVRLQ